MVVLDLAAVSKRLGRYSFLIRPHYFINIILACAFFATKTLPYVCDYLYDSCDFDVREMSLITFLGCVLAMKTRKQRHSFKDYLGSLCMFSKILSVLLFSQYSILMAVIYAILCLVHLVFLSAPVDYSGPQSITYFRGPNLQDELQRDTRVTWLIAFYASWSPVCVSFAEVFAKLSYDYGLDNLKFGKIDASRYPEVAEKFKVDGSAWSKQLPTVILFEKGKEVMRRPYVDYKGTVQKFFFSEKDMKDHFSLNDLYKKCNAIPLHKKANKVPVDSTNSTEKKEQ